MTLTIIIVSAFLLANIIIGWYCKNKNSSLDQYAVGQRKFNSWLIFATLSATFIGGGFTLGNAAKVYQHGIWYAATLSGFSLKEIIVALWIAPRMEGHRDCISIGDIMKKTFGKQTQVFTGILSVLVCMGICGAQVAAMGAIGRTFLHLSPLLSNTISFAILIFYSSLGGMRAVVYTDVLQFIVLAVGIPLVFIIALPSIGGWSALIHSTTSPAAPQNLYSITNHTSLLISLFIAFLLGETLVPPYVQRLLMAKHGTTTRSGTLASGIFSIPFFLIVGGIGSIALHLNSNIDANTALPYVIKTTTPLILQGIVIASLLSIIMSSVSGFLNAAAIAVANDILKPITKPQSQKTLLTWARISTVITGVGALVFALSIHSLLNILLISYSFWAPIMLIPIIFAILRIKSSATSLYVGAICGVSCTLLWKYVLQHPWNIQSVPIGVAGNYVGFMLTQKWHKYKNIFI